MFASRRKFLRSGIFGAAAIGASSRAWAQSASSVSMLQPDDLHPRPATFDRLPLEWYKRQLSIFRQKCGEEGCDAMLLQNRWNIIYFTGLFHTSTERPFRVLIPVEEEAIFWYSPGLDRDLVTSWWSTDNQYYFDYLHARDAYPDQGKVLQNETVDLWEWTLKGLKKRGLGEKVIGIDGELSSQDRSTAGKVMPRARFRNISDIALKMRMVKTPEEIELLQRVYTYFSKIHAFARDYILGRGTDATDFEVRHATIQFGTDLILADIKRDGRPHNAVGIDVGIGCRTGVATAYPHPNHGNTCSQVAYKIHKLQVEREVEKLIYHRPGHGEGMEGHQAPWLALGDYTMLRKGMTFSVEPGLYDPQNGFGYNPSDNCLVWDKRGIFQSSVPWTKEWMYLKL